MKIIRPQIAKYIIEVYFDSWFSVHKSNIGIISLWIRTPAGLGKVYRCPRCDELIPDRELGGDFVKCSCGWIGFPRELVGETLFKLNIPKWAKKLAYFVRKMEVDADIILRRGKIPISIIEAEMVARENPKGGELLDKARKDEKAIYTKQALIKDLSSGMSMEDAIAAFLKA